MTRKRFVKLLMSYGVQRNRAEAIAWMYSSRGQSYEQAMQSPQVRWYKAYNDAHKAAASMARSIVETLMPAVRKVAAELREIFQACMSLYGPWPLDEDDDEEETDAPDLRQRLESRR